MALNDVIDSLTGLGKLFQNYFMGEYERKRELEEWKKRENYGVGIRKQEGEDTLARQLRLHEATSNREAFEARHGKDPYLWNMYEKKEAGDPHSNVLWTLYEDLDRRLQSGKPIGLEDQGALSALPPTVQADITKRNFDLDQALKNIARTEEEHAAQMKNYERLGRQTDIQANRGQAYVDYLRKRTADVENEPYSNIEGKQRHAAYKSWGTDVEKAQADERKLREEILSRRIQARNPLLTQEQRAKAAAELEALETLADVNSQRVANLAGTLPTRDQISAVPVKQEAGLPALSDTEQQLLIGALEQNAELPEDQRLDENEIIQLFMKRKSEGTLY